MGQTHQIFLEDATGMAQYDGILRRTYERADVVLICAEEGSEVDLTELGDVWLPKVQQFRMDQLHLAVCVRGADSELRSPAVEAVAGGFSMLFIAHKLGFGFEDIMACDLRKSLDVRRLLYDVRMIRRSSISIDHQPATSSYNMLTTAVKLGDCCQCTALISRPRYFQAGRPS